MNPDYQVRIELVVKNERTFDQCLDFALKSEYIFDLAVGREQGRRLQGKGKGRKRIESLKIKIFLS